MFCPKCGQKNEESANFCSKCGNSMPKFDAQQQTNTQNQPSQQSFSQVNPADNSKLYCILSYIFIFWLIGLLVNPEKNNSKVKFHVGQGIVLTIFCVALNFAAGILTSIISMIFATSYFGYGLITSGVSIVGIIFNALIWLAVSACIISLMVVGILNAVKDQEKPLPIIGGFAFYK